MVAKRARATPWRAGSQQMTLHLVRVETAAGFVPSLKERSVTPPEASWPSRLQSVRLQQARLGGSVLCSGTGASPAGRVSTSKHRARRRLPGAASHCRQLPRVSLDVVARDTDQRRAAAPPAHDAGMRARSCKGLLRQCLYGTCTRCGRSSAARRAVRREADPAPPEPPLLAGIRSGSWSRLGSVARCVLLPRLMPVVRLGVGLEPQRARPLGPRASCVRAGGPSADRRLSPGQILGSSGWRGYARPYVRIIRRGSWIDQPAGRR
jgi:hypothetical protein